MEALEGGSCRGLSQSQQTSAPRFWALAIAIAVDFLRGFGAACARLPCLHVRVGALDEGADGAYGGKRLLEEEASSAARGMRCGGGHVAAALTCGRRDNVSQSTKRASGSKNE